MNIFVDIDQTISSGYIGKSLQESVLYYANRGIHAPSVSSYMELFQKPEVVRIHAILPGAIEGITALSRQGAITYATVRDESVQEETRAWLAEHCFPFSENVRFCRSLYHKLTYLRRTPGPVVLIDDRYKQLAAILTEEQEAFCSLFERMLLVCFGASEAFCQSPVSTFALSSWEQVSSLVQFIKEEKDEKWKLSFR